MQTSVLLTDLYQLTMLQGYYSQGMHETASFEFFVRKRPPNRNFFVAAGLKQVIAYLTDLCFTAEDISYLTSTGIFKDEFLRQLRDLRFTGDVHALPEGTVFFPDEPVIRVTAPLPQAQLVESRIINILQFQTMIASKAARMRLAAPEKLLVDFGMRRAHGEEAGLFAARAGYLAGLDGTSTVLAGQRYSIPIYGTMAHSFVQAHDNETEAFINFARSQTGKVTLLIDTFDTLRAAQKVVELAPELARENIEINAVRLDSGDLGSLARQVRAILDKGDLKNVRIFASGDLNEKKLERLCGTGVPIDGFGIGTQLDTSADYPFLDCAYKLVEYAGRGRRKRSAGKTSWPGRKQVFRYFDPKGYMAGDVLTLATDGARGTPLLQHYLVNGERVGQLPTLAASKELAASELGRLPPGMDALGNVVDYSVEVSESIQAMALEHDRLLAKGETGL